MTDIGIKPEDDDETRLQKSILVKTSALISITAIIWGIIYITFGEEEAGFIPISYAVLSIASLFILRISNIFELFRSSQFILMLLLPFLLMLKLGGFVNGSAVILWALLSPIGALLSGQMRRAIYWFIAFCFLVLLSGLLQPYLRPQNNLPFDVIILFFIINILTVTFVIFIVLKYFVKHKDKVIKLMQKNRELEDDQLHKELMLQESDKLATLGRLSAGIAHELNNPAAAALSGSKQLENTILRLEDDLLKLSLSKLTTGQLEIYEKYKKQINDRAKNPLKLDPVTLSDQEQEIEQWLEDQKINDAWEVASIFPKLGCKVDDLNRLKENFPGELLQTLISSLFTLYLSTNLLEEITQGTGRIIEIVKSLKSYSYNDKESLKLQDIHEGLDNTLVMMRSQLKKGINVKRDYADNLPAIEVYGNELHQVWTNIIDNAITAMDGKGTLFIKTFKDDPWIVIQIRDTGHGIPEDVRAKIFDPFFTTKSLGEGTGLGLNISYNIIVNRHHGKINVYSEPGKTCFEIKLPLTKSVINNEE